jgi:sn-glycerol 3-phosphate transport system permease protein
MLPHLVLIARRLHRRLPGLSAFVASTHDAADHLERRRCRCCPAALHRELHEDAASSARRKVGTREPVGTMLLNSLIMALGIAIGKIAISIISAFAIVYFRFPFRMTAFWLIFITLMLPVEVRIYPTYKVVADLGLLDSYAGLTIPLIASAPATFLFRQFFMTVPDELSRRAKIDGAGPMRFFWDTLLPLSDLDRGAVRHPVHLRLEPVSLAAADHHQGAACRPSSSASRR